MLLIRANSAPTGRPCFFLTAESIRTREGGINVEYAIFVKGLLPLAQSAVSTASLSDKFLGMILSNEERRVPFLNSVSRLEKK